MLNPVRSAFKPTRRFGRTEAWTRDVWRPVEKSRDRQGVEESDDTISWSMVTPVGIHSLTVAALSRHSVAKSSSTHGGECFPNVALAEREFVDRPVMGGRGRPFRRTFSCPSLWALTDSPLESVTTIARRGRQGLAAPGSMLRFTGTTPLSGIALRRDLAMRSLSTIAGLLGLVVAASFGGGCMRGATYRIPMPDSVTLGTVKPDADAELAKHESTTRPATSRQPVSRFAAVTE